MAIKEYFTTVLTAAEAIPGLTELLNHALHEREHLTLFDTIKFKLYGHESMSPSTWSDKSLYCGSTFVVMNNELRPLLDREFIVPILNIKVSVDAENAKSEKDGVKVTWKKVDQ
jgi:hypothetical protein